MVDETLMPPEKVPRLCNKFSAIRVSGLVSEGGSVNYPHMLPDWLIPLLIFLLAVVLIALWFRLRSRRRVELAGSAAMAESRPAPEPQEPSVDEVPSLTASEEFRELPPEIQAVREELDRIGLEEADAGKAMLRMEEAQAAAPAAIAEAQAYANEESAEPSAEDEAPLAEPEDAGDEEASTDATQPETAERESDAKDEASAQLETADDGDESEAERAWEAEVEAPTAEAADEALEEEFGPEDALLEAGAESEDVGSSSGVAEDLYDPDGRLILPMGMGDIIVPTETPRRLQLAVDRQWPLAVVQHFSPETERLVIFYDGPDATDIVMLPTINDTWQINLGGCPVVQVECDAGAEALGKAVRIRPRPPE